MRLKSGWLPALLCLFALLSNATPAMAALQSVPPLTSPVVDLTQTLTADQQQALANQLLAYEKAKGSQVMVLIVPTTQPEDIAQYSIRVAEAWKIGRAKQDDGVLLLVAKQDRKVRIEVGRGLEGAIPDIYAKRIISESISPLFKQGDFNGGILAGVEKITGLIAGEQLPAPPKDEASSPNIGFESALALFFIACMFLGEALKPTLGRFFWFRDHRGNRRWRNMVILGRVFCGYRWDFGVYFYISHDWHWCRRVIFWTALRRWRLLRRRQQWW